MTSARDADQLEPAIEETLRVEVEGAVATVAFDRPHRRNGVIPVMMEQLHTTLQRLSEDSSISVVVLTGRGSTFCPGGDLLPRPEGAAVEEPAPAEAFHSATLLREMPQITVAAINGACAGAGLCWAAACDIRFAAAGARFSSAFIRLGLPGELGIAWTLPRIVGEAAANDIMLFPGTFDSDRAKELGFVSRVFPDATFADQVGALVGELSSRDPAALRGIKSNVARASTLTMREYIDLETPDYLAGFDDERRRLMFETFARQS